jgi:beta-lactamase regulating signal transducer with metallopeptidase domain
MITALMTSAQAPLILEAALRALVAAVAVWAGLRLLRVGNVLVQKAAWGLVLVAALAMPLAPHWPDLPALAALRLPALPWDKVRTDSTAATPVSTSVSAPAPAPDRYPAPSISTASFDDRESSAPPVSSAPDQALSSSEPASAPRQGLLGTGLGPYINRTRKSRAFVPEASRLQSNSLPISTPAASATTAIAAKQIHFPIRLAAFGWLLYLGVFAALLVRLLFGLASALRLWFTAEPVSLQRDSDSASLRLRSSPRVASPVNIGSGIILPANYTTWDDEKLRIVLAHERSHIRQGDFYLQLLAGLYASLFWFSPLGWWLKRKLSELSEAISDRAGLEEAASRSSYAQLLLEFAALPRPTLTGVAMARTSHLAQRIERLLNESSFRQAFAAGSRRALLAVLLVPAALFAATALVRVEAAAAPSQQATVTGQSTPEQVTVPAPRPAAAPMPEGAPVPPQLPAPTPSPEVVPGPPPGPGDPGPAPIAPLPPTPKAGGVPPVPPAPGAMAPMPPMPVISIRIPQDEIQIPRGEYRLNIDSEVRAEIAAAREEAKEYRGYSYSNNGGDPYALVGDPGSHTRFNGDWDGNNQEDIEKVRKIAHGHFLWFRHDGKFYIVDDPAIVAQIEAMNKLMDELGEQMHSLGDQMRALGQQQRDLGKQMRDITVPTPDLTKEMDELNAAVATLKAKQGGTIRQKELGDLQREVGRIQGELGALQGKIGAQQGELGGGMGKFGEQQGKLGGQMGELGAKMGKIARENQEKIKGIIDDSMKDGKAHPVE